MQLALCRAAESGDEDAVRRLVELGANPSEGYRFLKTPLHYASGNGHLDVVRYLINEAQVDSEERDILGVTALHLACVSNHLPVVRCLVETGGANVDAEDNEGRTPLHCASSHGRMAIVQYLVEQRQANVNANNYYAGTPLDTAIGLEDEGIFRYLLPRTSSVTFDTLSRLWLYGNLADTRGIALEKYTVRRGLADPFRENPNHMLFLGFPLLPVPAFQYCIEQFPSSVFSSLDDQGLLSIHVALTYSRYSEGTYFGLLFDREPRSAIVKDPTTGLYPHETAAMRVTDSDDTSWLDVVYKMFRSNPHHLLKSRALPKRPPLPQEEEHAMEAEWTAKSSKFNT